MGGASAGMSRRQVQFAIAALGLAGASTAHADDALAIQTSATPLPDALEVYYSFISSLTGAQNSREKLVLCNTQLEFDISQNTPNYNQGLFRKFVDRKYSYSPADSLTTFAPNGEAYSSSYTELLHRAADSIPAVAQPDAEIAALKQAANAAQARVSEQLTAIANGWNQYATTSGFTPGTAEYETRRLSYLQQTNASAIIDPLRKAQSQAYQSYRSKLNSKLTPVQRKVLDLSQAVEESMTGRPNEKALEGVIGPNIILVENDPFANTVLFHRAPRAFPLGDLTNFLTLPGVRSIALSKSNTITKRHSTDWGVSAGAGIDFLNLNSSGSASNRQGYTETIATLREVEVGFDNLADYAVDRGAWYEPTLLNSPEFLTILGPSNDVFPLRFVPIGVVIGRGLSIKLTSSKAVDTKAWSKTELSKSGGMSIAGMDFFGGGGGSSSKTTITVSKDKKTVVFKDDPQLARLLAIRLLDTAA
jgi:hypothetical protein